jgi:N-acetylmuramoyl-L-alanine amidase
MCLAAAAVAGGQQFLAPAPAQTPASAQPTISGLSVVVIDPAHGGPDSGARGAGGIQEKEVVLVMARHLAAQLERQGLRVVWTRRGDEYVSFEDRAMAANAPRGAIFITLHVGSTGAPGTARTYFLPSIASGESASATSRALAWNRAQAPFAEQSRRLAELVQVQIGQKLRGSEETPVAAPVRPLRHIAAPAIAVELASVSVAERKPLDAAIPALAEAVATGVAAYRPLFAAVNF